jgi:hypothetical protein
MTDDAARTWKAQVARWKGLAELLAAFEAVARDGAFAAIEMRGEVYVVSLEAAWLGDGFRSEGEELAPLLQAALGFYAEKLEAG